MIPKFLHQIWVGPNPIPKRELALAKHTAEVYHDYVYRCWNDHDVAKFWNLFSPVFQAEYTRMFNQKRYAWCADILRIWLVRQIGGIYLDIDFDVLQRFPDEWLNYDGLVFYHKPESVCINGEMSNSMIGGTPNLGVLSYCLDHMTDNNNFWYGPSWFGTRVKQYLGVSNKYVNEDLLANLANQNILGVCFEDTHKVYLHHLGLYSWSDHYVPEKADE